MKASQLREIIREEIAHTLNEFQPFEKPEFGYDIPKEGRSDKYLFTVANDADGLNRIRRAKEALLPFFKFRIRGRHDNRKEVLGSKWRPGTQNDVPLDKAQYLAVYVEPK